MNLTTHWILALSLGIAFFHNVASALVMSIGALVPDLDREYLFVARDFIGKHQLHRALFHNFFAIVVLYFLNPLLSIGALSHVFLDLFTSATDRGAEVFFPLTRIVKSYHYSIEGQTSEHIRKREWWVEDPWRLLQQTSDRDLQEPLEQPWRRTYGPFKNSRIVDWGIFYASFAFLLVIYLAIGNSIFSLIGFSEPLLTPLIGIFIFYGLGEWWRRKLVDKQTEGTNWLVLGILTLGLVIFLAGSFFLYQPPSLSNANLLLYGIISALIGLILAYVFVKARKSDDLSL